jgi:hypothetical protein
MNWISDYTPKVKKTIRIIMMCIVFSIFLYISCDKPKVCLICRERDSKCGECYKEFCHITDEMQSEIDKGLWICH